MVRGVSILRRLPIAQLAEPQFFVKIVARIRSLFQHQGRWERNRSCEVSEALCFDLMFLWHGFDQWVTTVGQHCRLQMKSFGGYGSLVL